jgi:hypothetical protein
MSDAPSIYTQSKKNGVNGFRPEPIDVQLAAEPLHRPLEGFGVPWGAARSPHRRKSPRGLAAVAASTTSGTAAVTSPQIP